MIDTNVCSLFAGMGFSPDLIPGNVDEVALGQFFVKAVRRELQEVSKQRNREAGVRGTGEGPVFNSYSKSCD